MNVDENGPNARSHQREFKFNLGYRIVKSDLTIVKYQLNQG